MGDYENEVSANLEVARELLEKGYYRVIFLKEERLLKVLAIKE